MHGNCGGLKQHGDVVFNIEINMQHFNLAVEYAAARVVVAPCLAIGGCNENSVPPQGSPSYAWRQVDGFRLATSAQANRTGYVPSTVQYHATRVHASAFSNPVAKSDHEYGFDPVVYCSRFVDHCCCYLPLIYLAIGDTHGLHLCNTCNSTYPAKAEVYMR
jgi:hypothetical protein